jgi:hypothetical protein
MPALIPTLLSSAAVEYTDPASVSWAGDFVPVGSAANANKIAKTKAGVFSDALARRRYGVKSISAAKYCAMDGTSDESTAIGTLWAAALAAATAGGRVQVVFPPGRYNLTSPRNLCQIFTDLEVIAEGAEFVVGAVSTAGWDLTPTDAAIFDNGIFYVATPTIDNFRWYGGKFTLTPTQLNPIQIGVSGTHTSGAPTNGGWIIEGLEQVGGCGSIVLRGQDVVIRNTKMNLTASGWFCSANRDFDFLSNRGRYIGVSAGETTWTNTAFLVYNNCQDFTLSGNRVYVTGGTAMLGRSSDEVMRRGVITDNRIGRAGLGGISLRTFTGSAKTIRNVEVSDNVVEGWQCSVDTATHGAHDGIAVGTPTTVSGATVENVVISDNTVTFLADTETWNGSTLEIDGSTSPAKKIATALSSTMAGINVPGGAGSATYNVRASGNSVSYAPSLGVSVAYVVGGAVTNNTMRLCGYTRSGGDPLVASHGVYVDNSAFVKANQNTIVGQCPGSDGTDAKSMAIRFNLPLLCEAFDNTIIDNDTTTYTSAQNNRAVGMVGSGSAWSSVSGINTTTAAIPSLRAGRNTVRGTYWGLFTSDGGHYAQSSGGILTVEQDEFVCVTTGSTSIDIGVTRVRKDATGAQTITLPDPSACTGTAVEVRNAAASDDITMAAAAGTITATTLTPGQYATFRARGTVWERVA